MKLESADQRVMLPQLERPILSACWPHPRSLIGAITLLTFLLTVILIAG